MPEIGDAAVVWRSAGATGWRSGERQIINSPAGIHIQNRPSNIVTTITKPRGVQMKMIKFRNEGFATLNEAWKVDSIKWVFYLSHVFLFRVSTRTRTMEVGAPSTLPLSQ
ncbi:hypothetical protein FH972_005178 [Carpinus fangiana]|uniref:Uncharacterized protein n=1 Tax=Carpinus fangiana TaxID=176857 RepID=A0A5N6QQ86_9ROSI|nr:hypothetical protein FH972_005178 [Carpinus fangiana]